MTKDMILKAGSHMVVAIFQGLCEPRRGFRGPRAHRKYEAVLQVKQAETFEGLGTNCVKLLQHIFGKKPLYKQPCTR